MQAYTGINNTGMPELPEIDSISDLKKLAGIGDTSYGEETSKYATNLGAIQRERGIKAGTDEWFRLWFAKPTLTGEQPYDRK